ncbi:LamG-like jellyroll fold domain-containing protein [Marinicella meishanensis]|uniref:LamG-like jellyroll fold domain-containing protein n=1 Tax=Marinicella meishanensis TaxID=2873263 RepID=UPI001CBEADAE|nr:LamG-like jellyroll fold domain-containing protein [Marinicella sp. NBU2979]
MKSGIWWFLVWLGMYGQMVHQTVQAQSDHAIRFYGTGVGPPGQQDRILIPVDDNQAGANSTPLDVGGDFTFEFWLKGQLADNATQHAGGGIEFNDYNWIEGNIVIDRDVWCGTERNFGLSLMGGKVRFGVGEGDAGGSSAWTIEGNADVLDGQWHHIAAIRNAQAGQLSIVVDGVLDFASSAGVSQVDLSYPDAGIPVTGDCNTGQLTPYGWYLVLAAEKHDAGSAYPSYNGFLDELRVWNVARTVAEVAADRMRVVSNATPGLVGYYRFEEGQGVTVSDSSATSSPVGTLVAGTAGNGQWVSRTDDPNNTAPIGDLIFAHGFSK